MELSIKTETFIHSTIVAHIQANEAHTKHHGDSLCTGIWLYVYVFMCVGVLFFNFDGTMGIARES